MRRYNENKKILEITIPAHLYSSLTFSSILIVDSKFFNFKKSFEVVEISHSYIKDELKLKLIEIETLINYALTSGYGWEYGVSYGEY